MNTMAFSMRCCRKSEPIFHALLACLIFLFVLFPLHAAETGALQVRSAELLTTDDDVLLNADFDINFGNEIETALNKGVSLTFLVEFQLSSLRKYWFDDEVASASQRVSLSYHALSRQYLLKRNKVQQSFATLQDAREELARIRDWPVFDKSHLKKGEVYQAALRMRLDTSRLPKALQVDVIGSEDWKLVSERYRWTPSLNF